MDGFTPAFFLNLVIALMSGGIAYGVLKTDLKNTIAGLTEERRLREDLDKSTDKSFRRVNDDLQVVNNRVATLEGQLTRE